MVQTTRAKPDRYEMTKEHKARLAVGREESRIIRDYLTALDGRSPRRGRRRTPESIRRRLEKVVVELDSMKHDPVGRLSLLAERERLEMELVEYEDPNVDALEEEFVRVAANYGERKGISYNAWREAGVPASVLRSAGIVRSA